MPLKIAITLTDAQLESLRLRYPDARNDTARVYLALGWPVPQHGGHKRGKDRKPRKRRAKTNETKENS